jgi:error-prone DNA polymerase
MQTKAFGYDTLAITGHNMLASIARAHARTAEAGIRLIVGRRLDLRGGPSLLAYPIDQARYGRLCRLPTLGKSRAGKEGCDIIWADLGALGEGLLLILLPDVVDDRLLSNLQRMKKGFGDRCYVALTCRLRPGDQVRIR